MPKILLIAKIKIKINLTKRLAQASLFYNAKNKKEGD